MQSSQSFFKSFISRFSRREETELADIQTKELVETYRVSEFGKTFCVQPQSEKDLWRAKSFNAKEPETNEWLRTEISDSSVFWDVGANIGLFSLYAAALNKNCKILAIEPESQNFASLCKNVFANNFQNIDVFGFAVNGRPLSIQDLYVSEMCAGCAVHNLGATSPWSSTEAVFHQKVVAASADELVESLGLCPPSIMKIDVDGIELEILKGARKMLSNSLRTVLVEIDAKDDVSVQEMSMIMSANGFTLSGLSDRTARINDKVPRNFIWKRH